MSWNQRLVIGTVVVLLTTSLVAANGVVLIQRTALDADFVTGSLDEAGACDVIHAQLMDGDSFEFDIDRDDDIPIDMPSSLPKF